jgi:ribonuclease HI
MAKKKNNFYAVKQGKNPGIYKTWDECKAQVEGFSGALYKGFSTRKEAEIYLSGNVESVIESDKSKEADITIYVDGSFDVATNVYGYGCVVIKKDGSIEQYYGAGNNPECVLLRNVAGEMLAAMSAVRYAIRSGCKSVNICYDYSGIEMWAIGAWKANNDLTLKYSTSMKEWQDEIAISFQKVAAHTGEKYNEMVDKLAKYAVSNFCRETKIGNEVR